MARKKIPENENDVKKLIKDWFGEFYSFPVTNNGMGVHGIPDRVGCIPITITPAMIGRRLGLFVGVEAKAPGRRGEKNGGASQRQVDNLHDILASGGIAALVDCQNDLDIIAAAVSGLVRSGKDLDEPVREALHKRTSGNG